MNTPINEITIIIVLYEEETNLVLQCLENIKDFKIIIVDNAGNKLLKKVVEKKFEIYKYVLNEKNLDLPKGFNQAVELCDTEYILNLQADCLISNKDISILLKSHKEYDNCFIASPTFYDKELKLTYNGGSLPEKHYKKDVLNLEGDVCVETILLSAILFKKKDIFELGLLDENFLGYYVDTELCRRVINKGGSIIQVFDAKAQHLHGQLKIKNYLKRTFVRNYYYTFDELYYFFKINKHSEILKKLKKKLPNYIFKSIINLFLLRPTQSVYYFSKTLAFYKFNKFLNKKN